MEKQEKKTAGVYLVLAALTLCFALSLLVLHRTAYAGSAHGSYTVSVQDKEAVVTAPVRVPVNVNTASKEELETLTGIGPSLAQNILDYRAGHGDFKTEEDLLNVKGIGEAKLEGFRAQITFTEETNENSGR